MAGPGPKPALGEQKALAILGPLLAVFDPAGRDSCTDSQFFRPGSVQAVSLICFDRPGTAATRALASVVLGGRQVDAERGGVVYDQQTGFYSADCYDSGSGECQAW